MIRDGQSVMAPGRVADCFQSHSIGADWDPVANYLSNQRGSVPLGPTFLAGKQESEARLPSGLAGKQNRKLGFLQALPASKVGSSASFRPCRQARSEARLPSGLAGKQDRKLGFLISLPASNRERANRRSLQYRFKNGSSRSVWGIQSRKNGSSRSGFACREAKPDAGVAPRLAGKQSGRWGWHLSHSTSAQGQTIGVARVNGRMIRAAATNRSND